MDTDCIYIYLCPLQCLSLMSYSFQYTGVSRPWLNLFLGVLLFLIQLYIIFLISLSNGSLLVYRNTANLFTLLLYPAALQSAIHG